MKHYVFYPKKVCSSRMEFDLDENQKIHNLVVTNGCNGNLKAIGKLVEGEDASRIASLLRGNTCGLRSTSCADQFSMAIDEALKDFK